MKIDWQLLNFCCEICVLILKCAGQGKNALENLNEEICTVRMQMEKKIVNYTCYYKVVITNVSKRTTA